MAGSINLSLSQQFDKLNGNLLSGGRLYFYAAGTDSPQNAFRDTLLTLVHPNPIVLTSDGRVPQLYFADGSIHVRLTNSAGIVQFDEDFVLVVGPSSGSGGGGGSSVDPNAIFQTGDVMWNPVSGVSVGRSGWVILAGGTIGDSSSPASYPAAECEALFTYLYTHFDNTVCPVTPGPRTTPAADWSNHKKIQLLDCREITLGGLSNMGGGVGDRGGFSSAAVPVERGTPSTAAAIIGEIRHQLIAGEVPSHSHSGTTINENSGHTHDGGSLFDRATTGFAGTSGTATSVVTSVDSGGPGATGPESNPHNHDFATGPSGGGDYHNNTSRMMLGTFYMRL